MFSATVALVLSQRHRLGSAIGTVAAVALSINGSLGVGAVTEGQSQQIEDSKGSTERVRHVDRVRGHRLDSLLRPNDEILEVVDQQPDGMPPPPPPPGYPGHGQPEVQRRIEESPLVALVRIKSQAGKLTSTGDWVRNTVRGEVVYLYKALPSLDVAAGDVVTLTAPGGEVHIGRQRIRARHHQAIPLEDGRTHLVFGLPLSWSWTREPGDPGDWVRIGECLHDEGDLFVSVSTGARQAKAPLLSEVETYSKP